jgi:hypothetical protein
VLPFGLPPEKDATFVPLREGLGLVIPVKERLDTLTVTFCARQATTLRYNIYKPLKSYNYGPDTLIYEKSNLKLTYPESAVIMQEDKLINFCCPYGTTTVPVSESLDYGCTWSPMSLSNLFQDSDADA